MDFSQYGGVSVEWRTFAEANPGLVSSPPNLPPLVLQKAANEARSRGSKKLLEQTRLGRIVATEDHIVPTQDGQSITLRVYRPKSFKEAILPTYIYLRK